MQQHPDSTQRTEPATASETHPTTTSILAKDPMMPPTPPVKLATEIPLLLEVAGSPPPVGAYLGKSAKRGIPVPIPTPDQPLADFIEPLRAHLLANNKRTEGTNKNIVSRLNSLKANQPDNLWPAFTTVGVRQLRKNDITNLQECLNNAVVVITGEPYSDDTKNVINSAVRQLLEYLCDELEYISDETFARLAGKLKFYSTGSRPFTAPSDMQIGLMRHYLEQRNLGRSRRFAQIPIMFEVYLTFGPRKGTIKKLTAGDLDFATSRIQLHVNKQKKNKVPPVLNLLMPPRLKLMLQDYVKQFNLQPHDRLFTILNICHSLKSAARAAGVANWYHHAFRKLVATRMIEMNVPVPIIAALLGHRDSGATILKNYWNYSQNALDAAMVKYTSSWEVSVNQSPGELIQLQARLVMLTERVVTCPPEVLKPLAETLLRWDGYIRAGNFNQVLEELPTTAPVTLPDTATAGMPGRPELVLKDKRSVVARNVHYLQLRHGWGTFELEAKLNLYGNAVNALRRGNGLNQETLKVLAHEFKVPLEYFRNPANPQANLPRLRANLQYLADQLGAASLPWPSVMAKVLQGTHLPCGKILRLVAEMIPGLTIEMLMDIEISTQAKIVQTVADLSRTRLEYRNNIADHIQIYYWSANVNGMELARRTGLKPNLIHAYASGRQLAPPENQVIIAQVLGLTLAELQRPATMPTATEIGLRVSEWLSKMELTPLTAAQKIGIPGRHFVPVAAGECLPSASQLKRMIPFFNRPIEAILGIRLPAAPIVAIPPSGTGNPAATPDNQSVAG